MDVNVTFKELDSGFAPQFNDIRVVDSGGYDRGYEEGLAARTYETWTITLTDGTVIEKEVALL